MHMPHVQAQSAAAREMRQVQLQRQGTGKCTMVITYASHVKNRGKVAQCNGITDA